MRPARLPLLIAVLTLAASAGPRGIPPRTSRAEYFVTSFTHSLAVAATLVPPEQVRRRFGASVAREYVVVEIGVYSKTRAPVEVWRRDFELRLRPSGAVVKPSAPDDFPELLPEGVATRPVAGYLFFPIRESGRESCEVEYTGNGVWFSLPVRYQR
ncbi:MAG: hypothetical protein HYR60_23095 [Acidobacteria bacterium]|nr:hypothetical protein [Acidobacteriota bacterium]MBI3471341.1 hypothetical protein [Candidatus Solibacter usitatus]